MKKILVLCSGGLDSTVLLAKAVDEVGNANVIALNIFYGQKHAKEQEFAEWQTAHYGVKLLNADLSEVFNFNKDCCALLEGSNLQLEHKSYAEQLTEKPGTVSAYVPFRNGLFLSYATAVALQLDCDTIYYGAHADDAVGAAYPDCTPTFISHMQTVISAGTAYKVGMEAPFWNCNKGAIVALGKSLQVDFAHTWSCYEGKETPCGTCGTCIDRIEALRANGITDII